MYLRPVRFVDTPVGLPDGGALRLAGGMLWFAAYEVRERGGERTIVPVEAFEPWVASLSPAKAERARLLHRRITAPRAPLMLGDRVLRFDQPQVMAILNVTPDSFSDGGRHVGDPSGAAAVGVAMAAAGATPRPSRSADRCRVRGCRLNWRMTASWGRSLSITSSSPTAERPTVASAGRAAIVRSTSRPVVRSSAPFASARRGTAAGGRCRR